MDELPTTAATPMIMIPVPKKKDDAIEIPKNLRNIMFKNVYRLAHPRLIIIFPTIAQIKEPILHEKEVPLRIPANTAPVRYVMHIQAIENAPTIVFDIM